MKRIGWAVVALALVAVITGSFTLTYAKRPPSEPSCLCPDVFDPVVCSDGNTYSNFCYAGCAHATGCVRTGDI